MGRIDFYHRNFYHTIRDRMLLKTPVLSFYFKEVIMRDSIKPYMDSKRKELLKWL